MQQNANSCSNISIPAIIPTKKIFRDYPFIGDEFMCEEFYEAYEGDEFWESYEAEQINE